MQHSLGQPPRAPSIPDTPGLGPPGEAALLDGLAEVVFHTDAGGRWTYLNRAWHDMAVLCERGCPSKM